MIKIRWPVALAGLFFSLLAWYVFYSQSLVNTLNEDAQVITSMFAMYHGLPTGHHQTGIGQLAKSR